MLKIPSRSTINESRNIADDNSTITSSMSFRKLQLLSMKSKCLKHQLPLSTSSASIPSLAATETEYSNSDINSYQFSYDNPLSATSTIVEGMASRYSSQTESSASRLSFTPESPPRSPKNVRMTKSENDVMNTFLSAQSIRPTDYETKKCYIRQFEINLDASACDSQLSKEAKEVL